MRGNMEMLTAEQYALLQKAEEYELKAREEADLFTKKALEAVAGKGHSGKGPERKSRVLIIWVGDGPNRPCRPCHRPA